MCKLKSITVFLLWIFFSQHGVWAEEVDHSTVALSTFFTPIWTLSEGLAQPESVIYDAKRTRFYVSNVQGHHTEKDGKGYISIVSLTGQLVEKEWVNNLNAPKGMAIVTDILYVSDIDTLVAIDLKTAKVVEKYVIKTSKFLNDVTADEQGNVYVSDMSTNSIYYLCEGKLALWLRDAELMNPNGLLAEKRGIVVASWGIITEGLATSTTGHLKLVSYTDKKISSLGNGKPIGNLDGVESDGKSGYYVTDWMAGKLFHFDQQGQLLQTMQLKPGAADHAYLADKSLLLIPMMNDNQLMAFKKK